MSSAAASKKKGGTADAADDRRSGRLRTKVRVRSVIDPETRRQVAQARLKSLESDNFDGEGGGAAAVQKADADAYVEEDDDDEVTQGGGGANKNRKRKNVSKAAAAAPARSAEGARAAKVAVTTYRIRNFDHVVAEEEYDEDTGVNYKTIAAPPSGKPARHFCSVCGFFADYTCTRCGLRFCCLRCQATHKETRCLKFSE